ncbi:MAG: alpha/beta fold hydrolase [Oligoflexia bacterium]|nr:alpha/beta fold hydrolase [Oligoflexia bacterium]
MKTLVLIFVISLLSPFATANGEGASFLKTKYPIVFTHGILGYDTLFKKGKIGSLNLGVQEIDYYFKIIDQLKNLGATAYMAKIPSSASSQSRGDDLIKHIKEILAKEHANKIHLLGHSQGGQTIRYVLAKAPHLLASVTTMATPHQGSAIPDFLLSKEVSPKPFFKSIIYKFFNLLGITMEFLSDSEHPQNSKAALYELSSIGARNFNEQYPIGLPKNWRNDPCDRSALETNYQGVYLYSWNAVRPYDYYNALDPIDYLLLWTGRIFVHMENIDGEENDGLVGKCSMYFGEIINEEPYIQNHLEEINLSVRSLLGLPFSRWRTDPMPIYINHVKRLQTIEQ